VLKRRVDLAKAEHDALKADKGASKEEVDEAKKLLTKLQTSAGAGGAPERAEPERAPPLHSSSRRAARSIA
jgi:hypothetical protein